MLAMLLPLRALAGEISGSTLEKEKISSWRSKFFRQAKAG
jgi:Na+/melibiose symporter-like transporter